MLSYHNFHKDIIDNTETHTIICHADDIEIYAYVVDEQVTMLDPCGYGAEYEDKDTLENLYVKFKGTVVSLSDIARYVEDNFEEMMEDLEKEAQGDAAHAREMSSLRMTGRV